MPPEVSVIIPSYKTTRYVGPAIDSVLNQTFQSFEIVVVSDGCPDSAALEEVLRPYGSRVQYIWQPNRGQGAARNTAIRASSGQYIVQLDADDLLDPACLEWQTQMMREHPEYDAVYCNSLNFAESPAAAAAWQGHDRKFYMDLFPSSGDVSFCNLLEGRTVPRVLGSILKRDTLMRIGMYDEVERLAEDLDLWLRMLKANPPGRIGYTTQSLGRYRLREDNCTMDGRGPRRLLASLDKAARLLDLTFEERECLNRRRALNQFDVDMVEGRIAIHERRWKDAARCYQACYDYSRRTKYLAAASVLRSCPWVVPVGLSLIGRN
jgi:glycosyltransferase involved in cell wall biosynthesis